MSKTWHVFYDGKRVGIFEAHSEASAKKKAREHYRAQGQTLAQAVYGLPGLDGTGLRGVLGEPATPPAWASGRRCPTCDSPAHAGSVDESKGGSHE